MIDGSCTMNYSMANADRATHLRIVLATLIASTAIIWIGLALS
jgi:hypothetical protein